MKKRIISTVLILILVLSLPSCSLGKNSTGSDSGTTGKGTTKAEEAGVLPDFSVYTADKEKVTLYEKLGGPVVLNFWATWCPPCKNEMPHFQTMYEEYGDKVEFMMVNLTDGQRDTYETVSDFLSQSGYTFPVYYDSHMNAAAVYGVQSIPMTVFINADGTMADYKIGAISDSDLKRAIESLIEAGE